MRTIFTLTCAILFFSAHTQIIFEEYFENGMPESFVLENLDGLVPDDPSLASMADSAWTVRFISTQGFGEGVGSNAAFSVSWYVNDEGPSDDWMILPGIELGADPYLQWSAMAITSSGTFRDRYQVFVVTEGQDLANFFLSAPLFDTGEEGENTQETFRSLQLSDFAGQTVYIAFRNFTQPYDPSQPTAPGNGGNELALDNIVLSDGPVSVQEVSRETIRVRTWPQPATEQLRFELPVDVAQLSWNLYDLTGRMVTSNDARSFQPANTPVRINVSHLPVGHYVLNILADGQMISTPVMIVR